MSITIKIILDTRRMKIKGGLYPVKLQVTAKRKTQHCQTIFSLTRGDYEKLLAPRINAELQKVKDSLKSIQRGAEAFVDTMVGFGFYLFERDYIAGNELFKL